MNVWISRSRLYILRYSKRCVPCAGALVAVCLASAGCATQHVMRPRSYHIQTHLDPENHTIEARATIDLEALRPTAADRQNTWIALDLNENLQVSNVTVDGAVLRKTTVRPAPRGAGD